MKGRLPGRPRREVPVCRPVVDLPTSMKGGLRGDRDRTWVKEMDSGPSSPR